MSSTWLPFLLLAATCALVKTNGIYYSPYYTAPAYADSYLGNPYVSYQLVMPSNPPGPDCDNAKKPESESSSSESSSGEGGEKEKEGSSSSSSSEESKSEGEPKSGEEEEKKSSEESSSESGSSESSSSEEAETTKVKSGSALFPPRTYSYSPSVQQLVYPSSYYPASYKAYSLMQPYSYPYSASYQYFANPAARVISNPLVSSKVVSSPLVYPGTASNVLPTVSKSYSVSPGVRVFPASWNPAAMRYPYYKR